MFNLLSQTKTTTEEKMSRTLYIFTAIFLGFSVYAVSDVHAEPVPVSTCSEAHVFVKVDSRKPNGKAWDYKGGAPDIAISLNGRWASVCRDSYTCERDIHVTSADVRVVIFDQDIHEHDEIAVGNAKIPSERRIGAAFVKLICNR
ncbi:hypothetical protein KKE33_00770 [Patescibacteria group bacterium]|nr:hypothetical protein [Patescibacteria group bacterium]